MTLYHNLGNRSAVATQAMKMRDQHPCQVVILIHAAIKAQSGPITQWKSVRQLTTSTDVSNAGTCSPMSRSCTTCGSVPSFHTSCFQNKYSFAPCQPLLTVPRKGWSQQSEPRWTMNNSKERSGASCQELSREQFLGACADMRESTLKIDLTLAKRVSSVVEKV